MVHYTQRPRRRKAHDKPGHAHELTFSCYRGYPFLESERTRAWFAVAVNDAAVRLEVAVWAYVVMPEHVHLIVSPRRADYAVADLLAAIKKPVGQKAMRYLEEYAPHWLPRVTRRRGQRMERLFWQSGGGYDRNLTEPATLRRAVDYVHMNPVRRGLVQRAVDYVWSSAGWHLCGRPGPIHVDPMPAA